MCQTAERVLLQPSGLKQHSSSCEHNIAPPSIHVAALALVNRPVEEALLIKHVLAMSLHHFFSFLEVCVESDT